MRLVTDKTCKYYQNNILFSVTFFPENRTVFFLDNVGGKNVRTGQATADNMTQSHCMRHT